MPLEGPRLSGDVAVPGQSLLCLRQGSLTTSEVLFPKAGPGRWVEMGGGNVRAVNSPGEGWVMEGADWTPAAGRGENALRREGGREGYADNYKLVRKEIQDN